MEKLSEEELTELIEQAEKLLPDFEKTLSALLELKQLRHEKRNKVLWNQHKQNIKE